MNKYLACLTCTALAVGLSTPFISAQTVVTGEGLPFAGGFSSLSREADRVLQQFYDDTFFAGIAEPVFITSMSFRLPAIADENYPALGDLNFGRYDITLAEPSAASAAANGLTSATFADNMSDPLEVRSGPMNVPMNSFIANDANVDAEFSYIIEFDTPYVYTPGQDLVMLVRHDGHGDANGQETRWNFDDYAWTNGTVVSTGNVDDAVANFGPGEFEIANRIQFEYAPIPEPATAAVIGVAGLLVLRRRR